MSIGVALLGCTGSIGRSALAVLDRHRDRFHVVALAANKSAAELAQQVERFKPDYVALVETTGREGLIEAATHPRAEEAWAG